MVNRESPKNLYRLLTCRDIDLHSLEGILLDHACLLDTYTMNRDAKILQYKKVLVDGCHWSSHKIQRVKVVTWAAPIHSIGMCIKNMLKNQ
jgi:hypothetical protein